MPEKNNQSLVLIKPDGLVKSLTGNILTRLSETKLRIIGTKVVKVTRELAEEHYAHLKDKPFFEAVVKYMMGKLYAKEYERVIAIVYGGENAIDKIRKMAGATNPEEADQTSIRGQYGRVTTKGVFENVIHCSANEEDAEREIKLWFKPEELIENIYPTETVEVTEKKHIWKK
ncbi:MAG: nucleoside-diphosphate kinase [Elusimicrobia bacterium RIFOXYA2_FULL_40_6]|nr:MAG: nucleoside-diphosphate kinase [Elusimicrobia bacterium RIFOXYA2_FULL_40_6]